MTTPENPIFSEEIFMTKERAASIIFIFIGIYGLMLSLRLPFGAWREPGPAMLPLGLSIMLLGSGALWLILGKKKNGKKDKIAWNELLGRLKTPFKILSVTVLFVLSLNRLGYLLTASLYVFILFFWVSGFRLWTALGLTFVTGAGSWYFFEKILSVQLPQGIFFY